MKKKIIGLVLLTGVVAISSCVKEQYRYLSTKPIAISFPTAPPDSGSGSLYNVQYSWDATSKVLTLKCLAGYGYVTGTVNTALNNRNVNLVAVNSDGNGFDTLDINLYPAGGPPVVSLDVVKNGYFVDIASDAEPGIDFTCVPLSTDAQWANN